MFSFLRFGRDAFEQRRKQQEVWKCIRRLVDTSALNTSRPESEMRSDNRYSRCLPALLVPCVDGHPVYDKAVYGVTKDFSDEGVALLSIHEVTAPHVICAFSVDEPAFLLGEVRQCRRFGGGFWHLGLRLCDIIEAKEANALLPLVELLDPNSAS